MGGPGRVARGLKRGQIWMYTFKPPDERRPVLILTRPEVIGLLETVTVAPITSTIRGSPGEVVLDVEEGLKGRSAANLDHIQTVRQENLHTYVGSLAPGKSPEVCRALMIALGCGDRDALGGGPSR